MCVVWQAVAKRTTTYKTAIEEEFEEDDNGVEAIDDDLYLQQVRPSASISAQYRHFLGFKSNYLMCICLKIFYGPLLYMNTFFFTLKLGIHCTIFLPVSGPQEPTGCVFFLIYTPSVST